MTAAASPWQPRPRPATRPGDWPDEAQVRQRLVQASVQLVALRNEVDAITADLSWLQITAAGAPDLGDDR